MLHTHKLPGGRNTPSAERTDEFDGPIAEGAVGQLDALRAAENVFGFPENVLGPVIVLRVGRLHQSANQHAEGIKPPSVASVHWTVRITPAS